MTVKDAKEILAANWWKHYPKTFKYEEFELIIGDVVEETLENDECFPNSYIINIAIPKKGSLPSESDWFEFAISKTDGDCRPAIAFH